MATFDRFDDEAGDEGQRWRLRAGGEIVAEGPGGHWASEAARRALERVRDRLQDDGP